MWKDKRLCDLLGIAHPIIQAPMAGSSTVAMAAAASNAGCLGSHGCAMMSPDVYKRTHNDTRALTNAPLNMNFFCHAEPGDDYTKNATALGMVGPYYEEFALGEVPAPVPKHFSFNEEMAQAVLESAPAVVSFHFGLPEASIVQQIKDRGIKILSSATTVAEAKDLESKGVDAIIAQGWEAGGHQGFYLDANAAGIGTFALVPQVVDAVTVPVIAAGGIADGRGIAAALALGASGVQIGTAFLTCTETGVPPAHFHALMEKEGNDTEMTKLFSGRPARGITNRFIEENRTKQDELPDFPIMNTLSGPLRKASADADSADFIALWSGQVVGLNRQSSVSELIETLVGETGQVLNKLV